VITLPESRWFVALSPSGAARAVGVDTIRALSHCAGTDAVKVFDCRTYLNAFSSMLVKPEETMVVDLVNHAFTVQCLEFRTTHLLVLPLCPVTLFTLNLLRDQGIATAHWFYEDFRQALYWKDVLAGYDYFFAIQKGPIPGLCAQTGSKYCFLPTAASSVSPVDRPGHCTFVDAAFIGVSSPYRIGFLEFMASQGISLAIAGAGWRQYRGSLERFVVNGDWTDAEQSAGILAGARVGLNISTIDPECDRSNAHVSPRVFDVLQAGCALVTEEVPLIHKTIGDCDFKTFTNREQAIAAIRDVLSSQERERDAADKNKAIVTTRHTYENRVMEMMAMMKDASPGLRPPPR
jgi:hypothetical protein